MRPTQEPHSVRIIQDIIRNLEAISTSHTLPFWHDVHCVTLGNGDAPDVSAVPHLDLLIESINTDASRDTGTMDTVESTMNFSVNAFLECYEDPIIQQLRIYQDVQIALTDDPCRNNEATGTFFTLALPTYLVKIGEADYHRIQIQGFVSYQSNEHDPQQAV